MDKSLRNKNRNKNFFVVIIGVVIFTTIGVLAYSKSGVILNNQGLNKGESRQTKTFISSSIMKFSITVPADYVVVESMGSVSISTGNDGKILIGRNGTNFDNLNGYIDDLNIKNSVEIIDKKPFTINGYEALKQEMVNSDPDKKIRMTYFIYANNWVYSLSTSTETLFDDLDRIAESFRYTGD